ncbi:MAG: metallophosphoesterase [Shimia sp.]
MPSPAIYAIGDIHGQAAALDGALALIEADGGPGARIVFLGDYVDRGPDSRGVVERLRAGVEAGRNWVVLKGNHDHMFARYVRTGQAVDPMILSRKSWLHDRLGGNATLASYLDLHGVVGATEGLDALVADQTRSGDHRRLWEAAREAVPEAHTAFLEGLPLWHREGGMVFVHAGLRPGVALERQVPEDLMWIRDGWLDVLAPHPWLVVHGHTALDAPRHHGNRVNLDGGAGYGRPVVPAVFESGRVFVLGDAGRTALTV